MIRALVGLTTFLIGLLLFGRVVADDPKPPELTVEEKRLAAVAAKMSGEGVQLHLRGQPAAAVEKMKKALEIRQMLYPAAKYPDGHSDLARSLSDLGSVLQAMGKAEQARGIHQQALDMQRKLYPADKYPDGHPHLAQSLNNLGSVLKALGHADQARGFFQQALDMYRNLYPAAKYPEGHRDLATSLNNLGSVLQAMGQADQSRGYYLLALEMYQKLYPAAKYPDGHADLAGSLNNLGLVLYAMGQTDQARGFFQQALDMRRKLFPASKYAEGHPDLAASLSNMGSVLRAMGLAEQARSYYQQALDMYRTLYPTAKYPDGHPSLAIGLNNIGSVLEAMGQMDKARGFVQQALDMRRKLYPAAKYPDGHPDLAVGLTNLGAMLKATGQVVLARGYYQQALDMHRKLYPAAKYPNGHPDLAHGLNNLGFVLQAMGQAEQAHGFYQQSLDMRRKLYPVAKYPDGHPHLAASLGNLGGALEAMGQSEQARGFREQALDMNRKLYPAVKYPDGHPIIAESLNNLGFVLQSLGQSEEARGLFLQAIDMYRKLYPPAKYPDGHAVLGRSLSNLGAVLQAMGQPESALPATRDSFAIHQRHMQRELATSSEEAAFDKVHAQPLFRDGYLSVTRATKTSADEVAAQLWPSRSMVTRLLEQRQANARIAGTELGDKLDDLRGTRRYLDHLLQDTRMKPDDRDKLIAKTLEKRDRLERELIAAMPTLKRGEELDKLGPADLAKVLPQGTVFVDVIRYTHIEYENNKQKRTPSYAAFVVVKDRPTQRVEMDAAEPIDAAVRQWRDAIEMRHDEPKAVAELQRLVWDKLAPAFPTGTTTLYLAADGDLARLPWAALPVGGESVLLEKFAVAQVPHGLFLLDQLRNAKKREGSDSLLTLGGVDYGPGIWPALPGTTVESDAIAALAPGERYAASGGDATKEKLAAMWPKARYIHLATHGEFKETAFAQEQERARKARESAHLSDGPRGIGAKNPLGYVGIVLAGGEVLSGLQIVDLHLENVHLVTLSACETGLGALTGGEGVQGLQRAFHLAGCSNVVASLWKVNDAATAALMAKFYHELWVNKKSPIEALREAQLFIYYNPDKIPHVLGERGAPKRTEALAMKNPAKPQAGKRADTKLWAAFVLSGVGR